MSSRPENLHYPLEFSCKVMKTQHQNPEVSLVINLVRFFLNTRKKKVHYDFARVKRKKQSILVVN
jgi:hypothetical protein